MVDGADEVDEESLVEEDEELVDVEWVDAEWERVVRWLAVVGTTEEEDTNDLEVDDVDFVVLDDEVGGGTSSSVPFLARGSRLLYMAFQADCMTRAQCQPV